MVTELKGAIKLAGLPDLTCFESWEDFLKQLPNLLSLEIPASITNVVVGSTQPTDAQRDSVWFRLDYSGTFVGIYVFSSGSWKQAWPVPDGVYWVYNQNGDIPEGYSKIDNSRTDIPSTVVSELMQQYVQDPTDTWDIYFAVTFEGL